MDIPDTLLAASWYWAAWAVWGVVLVFGVRHAPWARLKIPANFNVWLGTIVLLTLVWSMKAGVRPGLDFHLLGAALFSLCFGPWLAYFGLCLVLAGVTLNGAAGWLAYALDALLMGGVAVLVSQSILWLAERYLPQQFFVYVFVNGFFGSGLTMGCVGVVATIILAASGAYPLTYLLDDYLPYILLLGFSEAWLAGMLLTLFVIYRPSWVATFDDGRYLVGK